MKGMEVGPGTNLGSFSFFIGTWTLTMTAMMLPSALPTDSTATRINVAPNSELHTVYVAVNAGKGSGWSPVRRVGALRCDLP
jgi:predicted metal-binding membrane protein